MKHNKISGILLMVAVIFFSLVYGVYSSTKPEVDFAIQEASAIKSSTGGNVVATIEGQEILQSEYLRELEEVRYNLTQMDLEVKKGTIFSDFMSKRLNVMKKYDPRLIAFASLLKKNALYAEAVKNGFQATPEQINKEITKVKNFVEQGQAPADYVVLIKQVGEEDYWNSYAPRVVKKSLSIGNLKSNYFKQFTDVTIDEAYGQWNQYALKLIKEAEVQIVDEDLLKGLTHDDAISYLFEYNYAK